jgi:hypothetical protein
LKKSGKIQMSSEGFPVGSSSDSRFPYPDTEDWQKAIGAFNFWMSADVTAVEKKGVISYTMKLTIHAEDKYNFNPGMSDIATGTPDDANGNFELTGLGKQFMQKGTSTHTVKWTVKTNTKTP